SPCPKRLPRGRRRARPAQDRHHAGIERGGQRHRRAVQRRQQAERLLAFGTQLERQVAERQLAVQQALHQGVEFPRHRCSSNSSRSRSYARCIRIFSEATVAPVSWAISSYGNPCTCFSTSTSRCSGVSTRRARSSARRRSISSTETSGPSTDV